MGSAPVTANLCTAAAILGRFGVCKVLKVPTEDQPPGGSIFCDGPLKCRDAPARAHKTESWFSNMKHWIVTLLGAFCAVNAIVLAVSTRQDTSSGLTTRSAQETETADVAASQHPHEEPDRVLFDGWEKPDFALLVSGRLDGYIEPCGCTGLENQKGGLLRRHTFLKQLIEERGWDVASIDTGNQINRTGGQATLKLFTTLDSLFNTFQYQAVSVGVDDLKAPLVDLMGFIVNLPTKETPFVCANLKIYDDEQFFRSTKIIEIAGRKIGLTAVLGDDELKKLQGAVDSELQLIPVATALPQAIERLQEAKCDLQILIVNASLDEARRLAQQYPAFDVVVSSNGQGEPTIAPEPIESNGRVTSLIQVGSKGMHVGVLGFYSEGGQLTSRYQRVPLDARFEDSEAMKVVFKAYQTKLALMPPRDLQIEPKKHPSGRHFAGNEVCMDCHEHAYEIWEDGHGGDGGPHARATKDLTDPGERVWVTREKDPECLSCHVTGWSPQGYFPYETGYIKLDDEVLHGNGCENCHGPCKEHVEAEEGDNKDEQLRRRKEIDVTLEQARKELCFTCHDLDNSPDFNFDEYWPIVEHNMKKDEAKDGK